MIDSKESRHSQITIFILFFLATGHAIRSNCALRACNHFYRCRGIKANKTTVKQHDLWFSSSHNVTSICANFAKTSVMAKSSTRRVTIYINGKEVEASVKQIRAEMNRLVNEQM